MDTANDFRSPREGAPRRAPDLALLLAVSFALGLAACKPSPGLQRLMRPQVNQPADKSSLSVDQLKEAIAEYASESERRKFADALELGLAASSNLGAYRMELANRYIERKMFKDAYDVLVLASKSYPDDSRIYYSAAVSAGHLAKASEILGPAGAQERERWLGISESCYKRSLALAPRSTQALYGLAVLYEFELGRPSDAIALLVALLGIETRNVDAMLLLARCYADLGRVEEAANWYETAAKTTVVPEKRKAAEENRAKVLSGAPTRPEGTDGR